MYDNIILIPYRNRKQHLDYFLENTAPLIKKCMPDSKIVVIEQGNDILFNRGLLLNIGFKEYADKTMYLITHDVDINPTEDTINRLYTKTVEESAVMGIYTSAHNTLGGIIKMRSSLPQIINGFPNNFWGWGAEDKALQNRCEFKNILVSKNILNNNPDRFKYFTIFNDVNDRHTSSTLDKRTNIEYNIYPRMSTQQKNEHMTSSGLSNLEYTVIKKTIGDLVDHIIVDFNMI